MKYFDKIKNRIIIEGNKATNEFWDEHWDIADFKNSVESKNEFFVSGLTKKFITPQGSKKILEGGCGKGNIVFSLKRAEYDAYGVDFATTTVARINKIFPDLKISCQDVRNLNFSDEFFDGYWSLGVIEHFYDGYDKIIEEMERVLKNNGFLFLTFPYLSPLRKIKIKLNKFVVFNEETFGKENFYQFILDYKQVKKDIEKFGFKLIYMRPFDGIKGLKDEISILKPVLQKIYDSKNIFVRIFSYFLSRILSPVSSHSIVLVFKKTNSK